MKLVDLNDLKNRFDHYYELAHVEAVKIQDGNEVDVVMLPAVVFEQMRKEFRPTVMRASEIPDEILKQVSEKNYSEMDDWDDDEPSEES